MSAKRTTVIDLARAAGVSKSTVSLVLQGSPLVRDQTRARVIRAMQDLGYVYNRGAATLRQARSRIVGIVVNDLTNSFFAELAVGVDMIVQAGGYVQFMSQSAEDVHRQAELIASMREHGVAGLIISPARGTRAADLEPLAASGLPVVLAMRNIPGARLSSLLSDNVGGAQAAVAHLLALGHRRIGFVGGFADTQVFVERLAGYREALAHAGIALDDRLVVPSSASRAGGVEAIGGLLGIGGEPVSAALCFNDAVAFGVCDGLRARKLEPGADFSVVGFDDVIEARTAVPALTTVAINPQRMGQQAAQLLFKQINAGRAEAEAVRTHAHLVVRDSTAAPRTLQRKAAS